jgi:transcriptional regulator with XRE-family HTH domain
VHVHHGNPHQEEARVSHFGDLVKKLRKEKGLTLEFVAKKIGSHKGYVSGIENDKVNPPSVKIVKKFAKLFGQDTRALARLAWVDKAPAILREDAERFLTWCRLGSPIPKTEPTADPGVTQDQVPPGAPQI